MDKTQVNPWTWQDAAGFSQCWNVGGAERIHVLSGQGAISADGQLVGEGDFTAQATQVMENLQTVLAASGASLGDIVRLTVYLTDVANLAEFGRVSAGFLQGPPPAVTAIGVAALALPGMLVEVEATAVT